MKLPYTQVVPIQLISIHPITLYMTRPKIPFGYYTHKNNLALPKGYHYVNYASHRKIHTHPFDTLPGAVNCKNWEFRASPADTLYIQNNPYNNNFFMDLYIKNPDGTYTYFDPTTLYPLAQCTPNFSMVVFLFCHQTWGRNLLWTAR